MSKFEERIQGELKNHQICFETQKPIPLVDYPWKTKRSLSPPKCDIYLNNFDLYAEIKGFMTYQAVSKLSFLSRQDFNYYIFQGTEPEWDPFIDTYIKADYNLFDSKKNTTLETNIKHQLEELINLSTDSDFYRRISLITLSRLRNYISMKINEYQRWNGEWY